MKRVLALLLALILCLSLLPVAFAADSSDYGSCGEDLSWSYSESSGELTIRGTGDMYDYDHFNTWDHFNENGKTYAPWSKYHQSLTSVKIEDGVTSIGKWAFSGLTRLEEVHFPAELKVIRRGAFRYTNIRNVEIPEGVTRIERDAFRDCGSLWDVKLPPTLTSIGEAAFRDASLFGCHIVLPAGITVIEKDTFRNSSLSDVTFPEGLESIGDGAFFDCWMSDLYIPGSVKTIGKNAFKSCSSLKTVSLSEGVKTIGQGAFSECWLLNKISIPKSVTSIKKSAFHYDISLKNVYYGGSRSKWKSIKIDSDNSYLTRAKIHYK